MENVLDGIVAPDTEAINDTEETDFDHSFDLTTDDLVEEQGETNEETDVVSEPPTEDERSNAAFAQMRTQNKEYSEKIEQFDNLAKSLGMKDANEFLAKAKSAQIKKEAEAKGVPIEYAQEIEELRSLKESIIAEREKTAVVEKEKTFVSNVNDFVKEHNLTKETVDKLSQDLEKDGLEIEALMDLPKNALNRILGSYVGSSYQKSLDRKSAIKKELPIDQSSKIDTESLNRDLDMYAKMLAGKN